MWNETQSTLIILSDVLVHDWEVEGSSVSARSSSITIILLSHHYHILPNSHCCIQKLKCVDSELARVLSNESMRGNTLWIFILENRYIGPRCSRRWILFSERRYNTIPSSYNKLANNITTNITKLKNWKNQKKKLIK